MSSPSTSNNNIIKIDNSEAKDESPIIPASTWMDRFNNDDSDLIYISPRKKIPLKKLLLILVVILYILFFGLTILVLILGSGDGGKFKSQIKEIQATISSNRNEIESLRNQIGKMQEFHTTTGKSRIILKISILTKYLNRGTKNLFLLSESSRT